MISIIAVLALGLVIGARGLAVEKPNRAILEKAWRAYLAACATGKESEVGKTMSSFRLGEMRQNLAAAKRSLTAQMIKSMAEYGPDIDAAAFVSMLEKGPTAGLVYVQDAEADVDGKARVNFTFIKFVWEDGRWKYDGAMNIGSPKYQKNGKKAVFDAKELPETFAIDGIVRPAKQTAVAPYASAMVDVFCPGYKVQLTINDVEQDAVVDKSYSGLLKQGLKKGKNTIVITVTKIDPEAVFTPRVKLVQILDERKTKELLKFEPQGKIEGKYSLTCTLP